MDRATPVQMRKSLEVVEVFKRAGIRFVPMPVINEEDHEKRVEEMARVLDTMDKLSKIK